jgi:hypothetical protein
MAIYAPRPRAETDFFSGWGVLFVSRCADFLAIPFETMRGESQPSEIDV